MKPFAVIVVCLLPQSGAAPSFADGLAAYRSQHYEAANDAFAAELSARGNKAPVELRIDAAMASLRLLRTEAAGEALAPVAEAAEAPPEVPFLMGLTALQRAERAAAAARLPDAEPLAWTLAVRAAHDSVRWFATADERRGGWPAALRNAERAWHLLQQFEVERTNGPPPRTQPTAPPPPAPAAAKPKPEVLPATPELTTAPLTAAELQQLQQRLQRREQQKLRQRLATQRATAAAGDHDW